MGILNPRKAIEEGWITGNITEDMIQPNGIDFTIDKAFQRAYHPGKTPDINHVFWLSEQGKTHITWDEMAPYDAYHEPTKATLPSWWFKPDCHYDVQSNIRVQLPADGVSALLIGRSTLNRNGLFLTSGWYDSNFQGQIGAQLRIGNSPAVIAQGTRIGQIIFFESDAAKAYSGQYQSKADHWTGK